MEGGMVRHGGGRNGEARGGGKVRHRWGREGEA